MGAKNQNYTKTNGKIDLFVYKWYSVHEIEIDDYMDYYNDYRYQWNLNRMTPKQYGDILKIKIKKMAAL